MTIPVKDLALAAQWAENAHRTLSCEAAGGRIDGETIQLLLEGLQLMAAVLSGSGRPEPPPGRRPHLRVVK